MPTMTSRVTDPPLELETDPTLFQPNPTTVRFARAIQIDADDVVFDIGTGVGPLAITSALAGAEQVVAVDPVPRHCELARRNAANHKVNDRVRVQQGQFFEPFERDPELANLQADVIIGDVSGIADGAARALGWYPDQVPTGGYDGTDVIREFLSQVPDFLKPEGRVYFPIAVDLSDADRIAETADHYFSRLENAFTNPYIDFPLTRDQVQAIEAAYDNDLPPFIQIQQGRRPYWRGQILVASKSRDTN